MIIDLSRNRLQKVAFLLFIFNTIVLQGFSQYTPKYDQFKRSTTLGLGGGSSHYFGDIHPLANYRSYIGSVQWNAGLSVTHHYSPYLSFRVDAIWIRAAASDFAFTKDQLSTDKYDLQFLRNLSFRNDMQELSFLAQVNLKDGFYSMRNDHRPGFMPYVIAGISVFRQNPITRLPYDVTLNQKGEWAGIEVVGKIPQINLNIPLGIGIRKKLSDRIDLSAELCYRITFSDVIDGIKHEPYSDSADPLSNRSRERIDAVTGSDRTDAFNIVADRLGFPTTSTTQGNFPITIGYPNALPERGAAGNDSYFTTSVKLHFYFEKRIVCKQ